MNNERQISITIFRMIHAILAYVIEQWRIQGAEKAPHRNVKKI